MDGAPVGATRSTARGPQPCRPQPAVEREVGEGPTQFEALTAVALCAFAEAGVDACVVEAGLGGRLDPPTSSGRGWSASRTSSLDHTALLGDSREAILAEKLGVVTPGALVVCAAFSTTTSWPGQRRSATRRRAR